MTALVKVNNLSKKFGDFKAVDGVSLSVDKGDVLGFLGPNGAGKTTTMRMIMGYLPVTSGEIFIDGINLHENPVAARQKIGYLPEGGPLYNDMTPASFLKFIGEIRGIRGNDFKNRLDYVVQNLNISNILNQNIDTLSKGYKRRVALAQAILHDPEILILDEPTDGLDPNQKSEVRELIKLMAKDKSIIISTHILEEVQAICNRAIIIANGHIVGSGTPEELSRTSPGHNSVVIKLHTPPVDKLIGDIMKIKDVDTINMEGEATIIVFPKKGLPIQPQISEIIRTKKYPVEEIFKKTGSLDDAFKSLTLPKKVSGKKDK